MADPAVISCPAGVWTKVVTNKTTGIIHIMKTDPDAYYQTYRDTTGGAPVDLTGAVKLVSPLQISAGAGIDVYVWCKGKAGAVRVDL